jgi:hypothetical protein
MKFGKDEQTYNPSGTDVTQRWRKFYGWVPPSELPEFQNKWNDAMENKVKKPPTCSACRRAPATKQVRASNGSKQWRCDLCADLKNKSGFTNGK